MHDLFNLLQLLNLFKYVAFLIVISFLIIWRVWHFFFKRLYKSNDRWFIKQRNITHRMSILFAFFSLSSNKSIELLLFWGEKKKTKHKQYSLLYTACRENFQVLYENEQKKNKSRQLVFYVPISTPVNSWFLKDIIQDTRTKYHLNEINHKKHSINISTPQFLCISFGFWVCFFLLCLWCNWNSFLLFDFSSTQINFKCCLIYLGDSYILTHLTHWIIYVHFFLLRNMWFYHVFFLF